MKLLAFALIFFPFLDLAFAQGCNRKSCKSGICEPACKTSCEAHKGSTTTFPFPEGCQVPSSQARRGSVMLRTPLLNHVRLHFGLINGWVPDASRRSMPMLLAAVARVMGSIQ